MAVQILKPRGTLTNPLGSVQTKTEHATGSKRATLRNAANTRFHHSVQHTSILLSNIVHTKAATTSKCYPYSPTYLKRLRAFALRLELDVSKHLGAIAIALYQAIHAT